MKHWIDKFANAIRGLVLGVAGQSSFAVHVVCTVLVVFLGWGLQCELWEWCILLLCIALVLSLELVNSSLEYLARGLCTEQNRDVGRALDIASAAVLCASLIASLIGLAILGPKLWSWFS